MFDSPLSVLKFGSSVLSDEAALPIAVHAIYSRIRSGAKVLAVVSAFGDTTDELTHRAGNWSDNENHLAALLSTGELTSSALLGLALDRAGITARVLDAAAIGLFAEGPRLEAEPRRVDADGVARAFARHDVVVIPGFIARDASESPILLGRGGSDLSALFLGAHLEAEEIVLFKDVDGIHDREPCLPGSRRFDALSWDDALALDAPVVQHGALEFAGHRHLEFQVGGTLGRGTLVGFESRFSAPFADDRTPLRVALVGRGSVGGGIWEQLAALSQVVEPVAVMVRRPHRHAELGDLLVQDFDELIERRPDVLIEVAGDEGAAERIHRFLDVGDVVTADKAAIASMGPSLEGKARTLGRELRISACVGGAMPALESLNRALAMGSIQSIEGVLNGSSGWILDAMTGGASLDDAIVGAQGLGALEADPDDDLSGRDAARKLVLLARRAFGIDVSLSEVEMRGIESVDDELLASCDEDARLRIVAEARKFDDVLHLVVEPRLIRRDDALFDPRSTWNRMKIKALASSGDKASSSIELQTNGAGAGRYPSAEAVLADLLDVVELRSERRVSHGRAV